MFMNIIPPSEAFILHSRASDIEESLPEKCSGMSPINWTHFNSVNDFVIIRCVCYLYILIKSQI